MAFLNNLKNRMVKGVQRCEFKTQHGFKFDYKKKASVNEQFYKNKEIKAVRQKLLKNTEERIALEKRLEMLLQEPEKPMKTTGGCGYNNCLPCPDRETCEVKDTIQVVPA